MKFTEESIIELFGSKESSIKCCEVVLASLTNVRSTVDTLREYRSWASLKVKLERL